MATILKRLWTVPEANNTWESLANGIMHKFFLGMISINIILVLIAVFGLAAGNLRLPFLLSYLIVLLLSFTFFQFKKRQVGTALVIFGFWIIILIGSFTGIGIYSIAYQLITVLLLFSTLVLGIGINILLLTASILAGLVMVILHGQGTIPIPENVIASPITSWFVSSTIFSLSSFIILSVRRAVLDTIQRLHESEALYRAIIEDQEEFIVRWKPGGIRTFANGAYLRYFGISLEQAIGSNFYPHINEDDRAWIAEKIARLSLENPIDTADHRVIRPDGTQGWQQWSDRAFFNDLGEVQEYQSVGRDITAKKELEEKQLELTISKEREAFLRDFLNNMSHDLQTPIASIRTSLYLMQHNPETQEKHRQRIDSQLTKLSSMIADILHVARLENLPELQKENAEIVPIIEHSLNSLLDEAKAKQIEIEMNEIPDIHLEVDREELQRALSNLIANAIKYTPEKGKVRILSRLNDEDFMLEIADTGIGMSPEDLPHIFERFYRANNAKNFEKGTGLGLAIVKAIIELHGGRVEVSSVLGKGSRFVLYLPVPKEIRFVKSNP